MYSHNLKVMDLNLSQVKLGVHSTSVEPNQNDAEENN